MNTLQLILHGFSIATAPANIGYTFIGCFLGTIIGVLPGISPSVGLALLIPVTFGMDPTSALIMMVGMYYGAMYGGSTTSILVNMPGESSSVMTTLDGYQMARKGRAGAALAVAAIGSFIAGTIGVVALTLLAVPLARFALDFGPAEYFCLMLFAMAAVSSLTGRSVAKGLLSTIVGLMISTVGIDLQSGQARFTFGVPELQGGISFLIVVIGLFAIGEVLSNIEDYAKGDTEIIRIKGRLWLTREEWQRSIGPIIRGGLIGFFKGVLPGAGATISTIIAYAIEKRISRYPEKFGTGMIEGVAGPEAANNAATCGAMVPLLTLGIPASGTTAVLLGALIMYGIQPGPMLLQHHPGLVWGLVDSMYIGNVMLVILNLPLVGLFVRILYIPKGILFPLILAICTVGVYAVSSDTFDIGLALGFGVLGYLFRKVDIPLAPLVLAVVLGSIMEQSFRQAMTISGANPVIFVSSGICIVLLIAAAFLLMLPVIIPRLKAWRGEENLQA
ncbi:MAG TPA: tripartite tricarboxylate transporter permease [Burkholderiales bacterium]|nr:tripartite tricarboxylate transporter permease [Burkholderiales bacterium]